MFGRQLKLSAKEGLWAVHGVTMKHSDAPKCLQYLSPSLAAVTSQTPRGIVAEELQQVCFRSLPSQGALAVGRRLHYRKQLQPPLQWDA